MFAKGIARYGVVIIPNGRNALLLIIELTAI